MDAAIDILIVGSGMGGATAAAALAKTGRRIVIVERGDHLPDTPAARDPQQVFAHGHYLSEEEWTDGRGGAFTAGNYYNVGGNSKFYGAVLGRFREADFTARALPGGQTRGWPVTYDQIEPYYGRAEALYAVRGDTGSDPTDPPRTTHFPFPPVPHEPAIADFAARMGRVGLTPASLPLGVDIDRWLARAPTPWDAFPDTTGAKMDAESRGLAAALAHPNVELWTKTRAERLVLAPRSNGIAAVQVRQNDTRQLITAGHVILAAGAVNTAALLLASACEAAPSGVANRSDQVGRNFMNHNCSALLALHPFRYNRSVYQKTVQMNDFYNGGGPSGLPLGNIQLLGKISGPILAAQTGLPRPIANWIAARSVDVYAMSEDLPDPESRVTLDPKGGIVLDWRRSNLAAHKTLVSLLKRRLKQAGYPIVLSRMFDKTFPSHQCGTARMGTDPATSVVDPWGRSHDHSNLWIADASVFPASAAMNPALTVAAHALRCADRLSEAQSALTRESVLA